MEKMAGTPPQSQRREKKNKDDLDTTGTWTNTTNSEKQVGHLSVLNRRPPRFTSHTTKPVGKNGN